MKLCFKGLFDPIKKKNGSNFQCGGNISAAIEGVRSHDMYCTEAYPNCPRAASPLHT